MVDEDIPTATRDRDRLLADIAEHADALTDPRPHVEVLAADSGRGKPVRRSTVVPGLLAQLAGAAEPGVDGQTGGHGGAESCPVTIDAVSLHAAISYGAAKRILDHNLTPRPTVESNVRAVVGLAGDLDSDELRQVRDELGSWRRQAEVITGWRTPARELPAPCPSCETKGTLLARVDPRQEAWCVACGARWGVDEVGVLARHVSAYRARAEDASAAARTAAVVRRRAADERRAAPGLSAGPRPAAA